MDGILAHLGERRDLAIKYADTGDPVDIGALLRENDTLCAQAAAHGEEIKRLAEALAGVHNVSDDKTREIERQAAAHGESVRELQVRLLKLEAALVAASHALRSYQFSNSSPDLAQATADRLDALLAEVGK